MCSEMMAQEKITIGVIQYDLGDVNKSFKDLHDQGFGSCELKMCIRDRNTGDKFVIRFNDAGCISCMQYLKKHIDYINMFISEVGAQNVICLLNSNNPRIIRSFKKQ